VNEHSKYDHITTLYSELSIEACVRQKIGGFSRQALAELIHTHKPARGLKDLAHVGSIGYMFQTSELLLEAELFDTLLQQCGTVCRRQSRTLRFHSKYLSLG